jgi:hypothetical protein
MRRSLVAAVAQISKISLSYIFVWEHTEIYDNEMVTPKFLHSFSPRLVFDKGGRGVVISMDEF